MNLKQKKKQIIAVALAGLMVAGATVPVATVLSPSVSAVQETRASETGTIKDKYGNELEYKQTSSVSMSIVGANTVNSKVEIPETINGVKVRYIGTGAFMDNTEIEYVTFPEGLITIGYRAFAGCENLKEAWLPDSCVNLERASFHDCIGLEKVRLPKGVKFLRVGSNGTPPFSGFNFFDTETELHFGGSYKDVTDIDGKMYDSLYTFLRGTGIGLDNIFKNYVLPQDDIDRKTAEELAIKDFNETEERYAKYIADENRDEIISIWTDIYAFDNWWDEDKVDFTDDYLKLSKNESICEARIINDLNSRIKVFNNVPYSKNTSTTPEKPTTPTNQEKPTTPTTPEKPTTPTTPTTPQATKGSIMLDTANYILAPGNKYTIGAFIKDNNGKSLTPAEIKQLVDSGKLKVRDSRTGSIVDLEQLSTGHFRVTGKNVGTCYILYEIGGTHASVRIDVQNGVKQHGTAVRNTSIFTKDVF